MRPPGLWQVYFFSAKDVHQLSLIGTLFFLNQFSVTLNTIFLHKQRRHQTNIYRVYTVYMGIYKWNFSKTLIVNLTPDIHEVLKYTCIYYIYMYIFIYIYLNLYVYRYIFMGLSIYCVFKFLVRRKVRHGRIIPPNHTPESYLESYPRIIPPNHTTESDPTPYYC